VKTKLPDDFEDIFDDVDEFYQRLTKKAFKDMKDIEEAIRNGKLEGEWDIQPIEKPGMKGYIARGHFQSGDKAEPKILKLPEKIREEMREPLSDVFEDKDNVKLYVELPGVEQKDIQLNFTQGRVEIKARNFQKTIDLPNADLDVGKMTTNYKNGVLEIVIPKNKRL